MKKRLKKLVPLCLCIALVLGFIGSIVIKAATELPTTQVDLGDSFTARIIYPKVNRYLAIHDGDNVVTHTASTSTALLWKFVKQSDGSYEITNVKYRQCLAVADASGQTGANVQIVADDDSDAQRWYIYNVEGKYVFRPATSTNCVMDVKDARTENLANVQLYSYNKSSAQLFDIKKTGNTEDDSTQGIVSTTILEETTSLEETTEVQAPTTEEPTTEEPTTEEPITEEPTTEEPTTEELTTEEPTTEEPTTVPITEGTYFIEHNFIYLQPGDWAADNAWFAAYLWDSTDATGYGYTWVALKDSNSDGIYELTIPSGSWNRLILCRMNPANTTLSWDAKWNQTQNLTWDGNTNCVVIDNPWDTTNTGYWTTVDLPTQDTTEEPTSESSESTTELPTTSSTSYTSQGYSTASSGDTDGLSCVLYAPQNNTTGISTYVNLGGINTTLYTNSTTLALQNSGSGIASDRNVDNAYLYLCLNSTNWSGDFGLIKRLGSSDWEICTSEYKDGSWRWNAYSHSSDVTVTYDSNYIYKQWNVMDGVYTYYIKNSSSVEELQMNLIYNNGTLTYSLVIGTTTIFSVYDTGSVSDGKFGRAASITNSGSPTYTNENYLYLISSSENGRTPAAMTNIQFANTYYYTTSGYAPLTATSGSLWIYPSQTSSAGYLTNQSGTPIVTCEEATLTSGIIVDIIHIQNY